MSHSVRLSARNRSLSFAVTAVIALAMFAIASGSASAANADDRISGTVPIEVTRIDGAVPLIVGGTVLILNEEAVSTSPVSTFSFVPGFESLDFHFRQSSIEQFTSTDFATARAISGDANGTLTATNSVTGAKAGTGSYKLSMSNTPDCQMKGAGTWSMETDKFTVSGEVSTCVNWDASIENFTGSVDVQGDVKMKEEPKPQGGLVRKILGGLFK
jgi:hypothetical protein